MLSPAMISALIDRILPFATRRDDSNSNDASDDETYEAGRRQVIEFMCALYNGSLCEALEHTIAHCPDEAFVVAILDAFAVQPELYLDSPRQHSIGSILLDRKQKATEKEHLLVRAAENGRASVVDFLATRCKANVHVARNYALQHAASRGHLEVVNLIAGRFGTADNDADAIDTALCTVASNGRVPIVELLVERYDADVNRWDASPLMGASENGHLEVVDLLVTRYSANLDAEDNEALLLASENGHLEVIDFIATRVNTKRCAARKAKKMDAINRAMVRAASSGHADAVALLIERHGANVHYDYDAALTEAAAYGAMDVVEMLLGRYGADMRDGFAFVETIGNGYVDIAKLMLERYGVDVNVRGGWALVDAINCDDVDFVRLLVERYGLRVDKEKNGKVALERACARGKPDMVELLVERYGVDPRSMSDSNFYLAEACNYPRVPEMFVQRYGFDAQTFARLARNFGSMTYNSSGFQEFLRRHGSVCVSDD